jgi:hypothetical protein
MVYIIIVLAILAILFFVFKNKIREFITKKVKEKRQVEDEYVFVPVGLTRSFNVQITIEEVGGGKARLTISKNSL